MPYGCGEQNMVNFAPNIYVLKYLQTVNQLTKSLENKAKGFMIAGQWHKSGSLIRVVALSSFLVNYCSSQWDPWQEVKILQMAIQEMLVALFSFGIIEMELPYEFAQCWYPGFKWECSLSVFAVDSGKVPAYLSVLKLLVTVPPSPTFPYTWAFLDTPVETVKDMSYFCPPLATLPSGHFNNA